MYSGWERDQNSAKIEAVITHQVANRRNTLLSASIRNYNYVFLE